MMYVSTAVTQTVLATIGMHSWNIEKVLRLTESVQIRLTGFSVPTQTAFISSRYPIVAHRMSLWSPTSVTLYGYTTILHGYRRNVLCTLVYFSGKCCTDCKGNLCQAATINIHWNAEPPCWLQSCKIWRPLRLISEWLVITFQCQYISTRPGQVNNRGNVDSQTRLTQKQQDKHKKMLETCFACSQQTVE